MSKKPRLGSSSRSRRFPNLKELIKGDVYVWRTTTRCHLFTDLLGRESLSEYDISRVRFEWEIYRDAVWYCQFGRYKAKKKKELSEYGV